MDIYVKVKGENNYKGAIKIVFSKNKGELMIAACLTKYPDPFDSEEVINPPNYHTTRHKEFLHNTKYVNGRPSTGPMKSYYEFPRENLDNLLDYEVIYYAEISSNFLRSESFRNYPTLRENDFLINEMEFNCDIYCIVGPKDKIDVLIQELHDRDSESIFYRRYDFENFDLLILGHTLKYKGPNALTNKLGYYLQTHPNNGIGDFRLL